VRARTSSSSTEAEKEFQGYRTPDDRRLFPELYEVQPASADS